MNHPSMDDVLPELLKRAELSPEEEQLINYVRLHPDERQEILRLFQQKRHG